MQLKHIRYLAEAAAAYTLFGICKLMPVAIASAFGGFLGRHIGPHVTPRERVKISISRTMPELSLRQINDIANEMYDNLGRVLAEYPHISELSSKYTQIIGVENIKEVCAHNQAAIFISSHLANWELPAIRQYQQFNMPVHLVYRRPNNPYVGQLLNNLRGLNGTLPTIPKSHEGTKMMVKAIRAGGSVGILIDQKYNIGIKSQFLGRPAMTSDAFAQLALKYGVPIIPIRMIRTKGCHFKMMFYPAMALHDDAGVKLTAQQLTDNANTLISSWVKEHPGQWLWLHRRWSSSAVRQYPDGL